MGFRHCLVQFGQDRFGFFQKDLPGRDQFNGAFLPVNLSVLVFFFNMILLLAGFLFIGKEFVAKTVAVSILFPLFLEFFSGFSVNSLKEDALVSVLIAGCMLGIGAGLIIRSGASGGGFDTLAIILHKKFGLPVAAIMNFCDVSVILLQLVGHPVLKSIYGIMAITLSSFIVKQVITFGSGDTIHRSESLCCG